MAGGHHSQHLSVKKFEPSQQLKTAAMGLVGIGAIAFAVGLLRAPDRVWPAYLVAFFFVSCLGLGGLFFAAINHIARAGWSSSIRRLSEGMTSFIPVTVVGSLVLVLGFKRLYPWVDPEVVNSSALIAAKTSYLNIPFMIVRMLIFGLGMLVFAKCIVGGSLKQDQDGSEEHTHKALAKSVGYVVFFALSFTMFSMDLLMSLLPTWYSTIYGIYCFSGLFQSSLAFLLLIMIYMKSNGFVSGYYTEDHIHDVAKYLKGFTVFWAYIAFSQFMLIWYANIPEETEFYLMRAQNGWMSLSMALLVFKFIVPFLALLPRGWKRNEKHVVLVAVLVLVMQYLDIYWLVYPNFNDNHVVFGFYEIGLLAFFMGIFLLTMIRFFSKNSLVAVKDPRMHEALSHHVTY